jgi:glutathione S-transferase
VKLYMFPFAPNAAKVRLYLAEKRVAGGEIEVEEVLVNLIESDQKKADFLKMNPFGTVPVLEADDGSFLHESLSIIEYLEELHPEPSMWGPNPESRAQARQLERIADLGVLIGAAREIHNTNSPLGLPANPPVAAHYRERWEKAVHHLESVMADGRPFLAGERVTVADCTLQGALQFARIRELPVLDGCPYLTAWDTAFREREAAKATILA